ncbi:MAG: hypothetical protein KF694_01850 [Mesorhizobium sp.]|nr:hypothetical protein [Mesorhizobium sp.]
MAKSKRSWLTAFVPHRLELLLSPAWQRAPRPLRTILERLEIEHLRHGGQENGFLFVSYQQIVAAGVSRRSIKSACQLGEKLGLLEVVQDGELTGDLRPPNRYRLTYVPAKGAAAPTDEWKSITKERAMTIVAAFKAEDAAGAKAVKRRAA